MKRNTLLRKSLPLALCASLLLTAASAADALIAPNPSASETTETAETAETTAEPVTTRVWGTLTKLEDGGLRLQNSGEMDGVINDIILRGEDILYLDAVTGEPMTEDQLREGEMLYAYITPILMQSEPPQATAVLVLANIPADFGVPAYYEITDLTMTSTMMTEGNAINLTLSTDQGIPLTFSLTDQLDEEGNREYILQDEITLFRYQSDESLLVTDLVPGTRVLVWPDQRGGTSKIMAFPYDYAGYLTVLDNGIVQLNGQTLESSALTDGEEPLLPLRAVCEALGLTVGWDNPSDTITVTEGETVLFTYIVGAAAASVNGENVALSTPSTTYEGRTFLAVSDMAELLDLYLAG